MKYLLIVFSISTYVNLLHTQLSPMSVVRSNCFIFFSDKIKQFAKKLSSTNPDSSFHPTPSLDSLFVAFNLVWGSTLPFTENSQCQPWAEEFHQYIMGVYVCGFHQYTITGICGMVPDQLFSVGFLRVLWFSSHSYQAMRLDTARIKRLRVTYTFCYV